MRLETLIVHPLTRQYIERYLQHPAHALLLSGPEGGGKTALLQAIVMRLTGATSAETLQTYPYLRHVLPEAGKSAIGIEAVRELQQFTKLRLPHGAGWRLVVIGDAQALTVEAQNALLKLLEEPPAGTMFLLSSSHDQQLLPTVRSRLQLLAVHRPSRADTEAYFADKGYPAASIDRAYFMSGGLPGLMHTLLADAGHPLAEAAQSARRLLQASQFERLAAVDGLAKDKEAARRLLFILQQMAQAALEQAAGNGTQAAGSSIRRWHAVLRAAYDADQALAASAQAKLVLTGLMLSL